MHLAVWYDGVGRDLECCKSLDTFEVLRWGDGQEAGKVKAHQAVGRYCENREGRHRATKTLWGRMMEDCVESWA